MGSTNQDHMSKSKQARPDQRSRQNEVGSSSRSGKERNTARNNDQILDHNFNMSTSELVAMSKGMGDKEF